SASIDSRSSSARSRFEEKPAPTTAPAEERLRQIAAPIPRVPPVTSATRPVRSLLRSAVCGVGLVIAMVRPFRLLVESLDDHGLSHPAGDAHRLEAQRA